MKQIALLFLLSVAAIVSAKPGDNAATGKGDTIQLPTYKGAYPYDVITFKPFLMTVGPNYVTGAPSWDGKGLHVGVQSGGYELTSDVVERDFVAPESSSLVFQAIDMYGDTAMSVTTKAVQEYFTDLQDFGLAWGQNKDALILGSTIMRGGSYQINLSVVPDIFILTDTMDVKDEAGIRIAPFESKLGMDVDFLAHITTGYPYNPDTLTGNETLRWVVSRMNSDSTYTTILEGNKKLRLKDTAKPLLAGLDSMAFRLEKPRVGRYKIDFTSDFPAANITTAFDVQDTLRATFKLDRDTYVYDKDSTALLHVAMDYKYPHIAATKDYPVPTIRIFAELNDSKDSLIISSDTLAVKDLNYTGDWRVRYKPVAKGNSTDTQYLRLIVDFNGGVQCTDSLPMRFSSTTEISAVKTKSEETSACSYNLSGQKVSTNYKGIVIRRGRKYLNR